jgi:hypothetical protein
MKRRAGPVRIALELAAIWALIMILLSPIAIFATSHERPEHHVASRAT